MKETLGFIEEKIDSNSFIQHVVVNVAKIVHAQSDEQLKASIDACDIINIDGMGVVLGARFLGHHVPERVAGIDLFHCLLSLSQVKGYPIFLLGAKPDVIEQTLLNLRQDYPTLKIAGSHHGYFWDDEQTVVTEIRRSCAKLLFVAITSPKKEIFINRWHDQLGVSFVMGVGGTFDVVAGKVQRAPIWMQKSGLEWLYRVIQEPSRMWKRYLVTNTKFLFMLFREKLHLMLKS